MILSVIHCDTTEHMVDVVEALVRLQMFHTVEREGPHGWRVEVPQPK